MPRIDNSARYPNWPAPANFMKSVLVVWVTVLQQWKASDVLYSRGRAKRA